LGRVGPVIDSRLDRVARTVAETMRCPDPVTQQLMAGEVVRDWAEFADEFPVSDPSIGSVTVRLRVASLHLGCGDIYEARLALRLALHDITEVQNR